MKRESSISTANVLHIALHELERHILLTGPTPHCDDCGAELPKTKNATFDDIEHTEWCVITLLRTKLKELNDDGH